MLSDWRFKLFWNVLKILFALSLAGYIVYQTELEQLLALQERISIPLIIATFILYASLTLLKALKYHVLIHQNTEYPRILNIIVMQNELSNFFTNTAGLASYLALLKIEEKVRLVRSGLVFLITKISDLFAVWIVMIICSALLWDRITELQNVLLTVVSLVGVGFVLFFCAIFWRREFISGLSKTLYKFNVSNYSTGRQILSILDEFGSMDQDLVIRIVFIAFGLSFLYYLLTLVWMVVSMRAFNFQVETIVIVFVSGILQLYSMIPITVFGGLGVTEVTAFYFYSQFLVNQQELSAVLIGWRILFYLTNLAVLIYLPIYAIFIEHKMKSK